MMNQHYEGNSNMNFTSGKLYLNDLYVGDPDSWEIVDANAPLDIKSASYSLNTNTLNFTAANVYTDAELFTCMATPEPKPYTVHYTQKIMIQKRYHKKSRVNKKLLKRYGMIPDTVDTEYNLISITQTPCDDIGLTSTINFDIEANNMKINWKPHQKINRRRIELL